METFGLYLLKSAVWLTGFALVFLIVLRNERYFQLNRIYLLSGIIASIAFPLYTWHYGVIIPSVTGNIAISGFSAKVISEPTPEIPVYWWFYAAGIGWLSFRLIWQTAKVIRKLRKAGYEFSGPVKLVRTPEYAASFSFFSYVFVNPSTSDVETQEIVNHEIEHIRQRHWFDLLIAEILCMLQWFNPFVWVYAHLVRQNHEYLADEKALQHTSDPAIYQATLLNQLLGVPVISLANSFSYSLNKKRFKMMKKSIHSPFRKLRLLFILPFMALVFYAFAKPEYRTFPSRVVQTDNVSLTNGNSDLQSVPIKSNVIPGGTVKGKVINADGKPLAGTSVIIKGSTSGTITDIDGNFKLNEVPKDGELVFSYVGLHTIVTYPDFEKVMVIKMEPGIISVDKVIVSGKEPSINTPLYVVDGTIVPESFVKAMDPEKFKTVNVLKGQQATAKYGEKGANGVIEVILKKELSDSDNPDLARNDSIINAFDPLHPPVFILDGVITEKSKADKVFAEGVESVTILKGKEATDKYGESGKDGVIVMVSKPKGTGSGRQQQKVVNNGNGSDKESKVFKLVEEMPQFPGGQQAMMKFIGENVKYPAQATADKAMGMVVVDFVIKSTGEVKEVKIARGVHPALDAEALRVIRLMPDWTPGKQQGEAVDVSYTIPIQFKLH